MDYEKKYKQLHTLISDLYPFMSEFCKEKVEGFFPELKESEDGKIRKILVEAVTQVLQDQYCSNRGVSKEKVVAWLEKQGEPVEINPTEFDTRLQSLIGKFDSLPKEELIGSLSFWLNVVQNDGTYKSDEKQGEQKSIWHNEDEEPQRGSLILLIMQSGTPIVAKIIEPNHTFNHGERWAYIDDLLKKQGEQKVPVVDFKAKDWYVSKVDGKIHNIYYSVDKVQPKFNVGDWVVTSYGKVNQVITVDKDGDGFTLDDDTYFSGSWKDGYHLWTIKDAKDGDVLCVKYGNDEMPFIFTGKQDDVAYCALNSFGEFVLSIAEWLLKISVLPATKEQRDLLFQKMKEAGYEWDAEKKKLKEIEDEEYNGEDWGIDSLYHAQRILEKTLGSVDGYQSDDGILEHKCAITAVKKLYEQKPAEWKQENVEELSDFENAMMHIGHSFFGKNAGLDPNDTNAIKEQAKLLLGLTNMHKWTEEDEENFRDIIGAIHSVAYQTTEDEEARIEWLKSLKQRIGEEV